VTRPYAILDRPYVSRQLADALVELQVPTLRNRPDLEIPRAQEVNLVPAEAFFAVLAAEPRPLLYTNSEDTLAAVMGHCAGSALGRRLHAAKDKALMRELLQPLYPDLWFRRVPLAEITGLGADELRFPLVAKPAVGFFSLAVVTAATPQEWPAARETLLRAVEESKGLFSQSVLDTTDILLEEQVSGEEYAVDTYFSADGSPVLLDVMHHLFRDAGDTDDKVYLTHADLIRTEGSLLMKGVAQLGRALGLADIAAHIEFRVDDHGRAVPIEINPLRLGGFCATDLAWHAYGLNTHRAFLAQQVPDWEALLDGSRGVTTVVLCKPPEDVARSRIREVRWDRLAARFGKVRELRPMDFRRYPLLALAFIWSPNMEEPRQVLEMEFGDCLILD